MSDKIRKAIEDLVNQGFLSKACDPCSCCSGSQCMVDNRPPDELDRRVCTPCLDCLG